MYIEVLNNQEMPGGHQENISIVKESTSKYIQVTLK